MIKKTVVDKCTIIFNSGKLFLKKIALMLHGHLFRIFGKL